MRSSRPIANTSQRGTGCPSCCAKNRARLCKIVSDAMPKKLSHYDNAGQARMVDVSDKAVTTREAQASAFVGMNADVLAALPRNPKGDPLEVARIAGIMGAKRTAEL